MGKIIAIGGGEIGRPGYPVETTKIDRELIKLSGKKRPRFLFIPTASDDAPGYVTSVQKHFGQRLGCQVEVLYLAKNTPGKSEIAKKIFASDIIYVGGGNTLKMMNRWRALGVDKILKQAYRRGIVLAGLSAGSICWFRNGNSDSRKFKRSSADLVKVSGLGLIAALHCPHYDTERKRQASVKKMMRTGPGVAIALDNCAALEVIDDRYRIIISRPGKHGYKIFWSSGKYIKKIISIEKTFRPLAELLSKPKL